MGFQFGRINSMNVDLGTECFALIIAFLIFFEYFVGLVDTLEENSPTAYKMIQKLFKELMVMGVISFSIEMLGTTTAYYSHHDVVEAISVAHIILFFMAIFYVLHAFLLILLSKVVALEYKNFHATSVEDTLAVLEKKRSYWNDFLIHSMYIPGSQIREQAEFKISHLFFEQAYGLPKSFSYGEYLARCFEKYCLELLDIGMRGWIVVIAVAVLNFIRVKVMAILEVPCTAPRHESVVEGDTNPVTVDGECATFDTKVFFVGGCIVLASAIILTVLSRTYEIRYK